MSSNANAEQHDEAVRGFGNPGKAQKFEQNCTKLLAEKFVSEDKTQERQQ
jgi:hypothetical protein